LEKKKWKLRKKKEKNEVKVRSAKNGREPTQEEEQKRRKKREKKKRKKGKGKLLSSEEQPRTCRVVDGAKKSSYGTLLLYQKLDPNTRGGGADWSFDLPGFGETTDRDMPRTYTEEEEG
jgi:hypothetical protein